MKRLVCVFCVLWTVSLSGATPVIYCTDLFHPHVDPDDHFDLATLFALPELEVKAIVLDQGDRQLERPGAIPLKQMLHLTGRAVPYAIGLNQKLGSPSDDGQSHPAQFQGAINLLVQTLRESTEPVTIITAGSVRDLCAAWNREPELLRKKVARLYLNIGNADMTQTEYNVDLDPQAYVGILRSGLPIYLCLCLPMQQHPANASTFWRFRQSEVLAAVPLRLQRFFIYALQRPAPGELDPLNALETDVRAFHRLVWEMERNMWCTASFLHAANRNVRKVGGSWTASSSASVKMDASSPFSFVPMRVEVDPAGKTTFQASATAPNVQLFKLLSPDDYGSAMRDCFRELLSSFKISAETR